MLYSKRQKLSQALLILFFVILCTLIIYPFLLLVGVSLSSEKAIGQYGYQLIPKEWSLASYKYVFENPSAILNAYKVTAIFSVTAMVLSVLLMAMMAFPLTRKEVRARRALSFFLYFTMLFSGGLVPTYILITKYLHLNDTIWVYILPSLISPWYVFMIRTFFQDLPEEIFESVRLDGGTSYTIFFRFVIPLSKPVLATVALLIFLGKWNDWYTALLYIEDESLMSLQYLLQRIMQNLKLLQSLEGSASMVSTEKIPSETVRMAMAVVVAGPALVVFPFFQKYFVKGLTVGSVKG
ncbi:MAG: carbohydrate ABC transporter permease [Clostridia bacterium]|nr:carbohydrate ABC transporter permease [Clostridia bacterium]